MPMYCRILIAPLITPVVRLSHLGTMLLCFGPVSLLVVVDTRVKLVKARVVVIPSVNGDVRVIIVKGPREWICEKGNCYLMEGSCC